MSPATDSDRLNLGGVGVLDERRGRPEGLRSISTLYLDPASRVAAISVDDGTEEHRRLHVGSCRTNIAASRPSQAARSPARPKGAATASVPAEEALPPAAGSFRASVPDGRRAIASRAREMVPLRACVFQGSSVLSRSFSCQVLGSGLCARLTRSSSSLRHCSPPGPSRRHRLSMRPRSPSSTALHCRWAVHCLQVMARARAPAPGLGIS